MFVVHSGKILFPYDRESQGEAPPLSRRGGLLLAEAADVRTRTPLPAKGN